MLADAFSQKRLDSTQISSHVQRNVRQSLTKKEIKMYPACGL